MNINKPLLNFLWSALPLFPSLFDVSFKFNRMGFSTMLRAVCRVYKFPVTEPACVFLFAGMDIFMICQFCSVHEAFLAVLAAEWQSIVFSMLST